MTEEKSRGSAVRYNPELRYKAAIRLRSKNLIAFVAERFFRGLQRLSPGSPLSGTATDYCILAWLLVGTLLGAWAWCFFPELPRAFPWVLIPIATLRVADITQVVVNVAIFDRLGFSKQSTQAVEDVTRSLVLLVWNFFELMLWFGLAYLPLCFLQSNGSFWSRFYFSGVTQFTIGYGDLTPIGWARAVAVVQGGLGWILTVIVLARLIASLPCITELARSPGDAGNGPTSA